MFGLLRLILMAFFVTTEKSPKSSNILLIGANNHGWHPGKEAFYPVGGETGLEDTHFLCPDALRFSHRCVCLIMCWLAFLGACLIRFCDVVVGHIIFVWNWLLYLCAMPDPPEEEMDLLNASCPLHWLML
ncbi:hypothetical protein MRB53_001701 [Persea americana]|uniref:Uncharacterized protein n=1 Tax=Persea americana TaxID=3435 RepID=A0ACC2MT40_PERAE|nr:hypothetical protein MRB53_001701 [Persea americana]